jgi:hypothetical protein
MSIGSGSKSASDAMKGAMLGAIADIAQAQGSLMLSASLFPPNPAVFAGGAALEVLAGVLKAAAGSSGGSVSTMTTTPGGANPSFSTTTGTTTGNATVSPTNLQQQGPKQAVNVTIEGDYLNTSESQRALMDVIRGSQDVSDFNLFKVGGT